jgi:hypothetical protein
MSNVEAAEDLLESIAAAGPPADKLDKIREVAREAAAIKLNCEDLEDKAAKERRKLSALVNDVIPTLLKDAGMTRLDLEPAGNLPGFVVDLRPYAAASIAAKWSEERRRAAFAELARAGGEDLIKVTVSFPFPKGEREEAIAFAQENARLRPEVREEVHHATLSAWLGDLWEEGRPLPDLEAIGGRIGHKAVITEVEK